MTKDSGYKQLLDSLSTAVMVVDGSLRLQHLNPAAEVLLSVSAARVAGEPMTAFFHESEAAVEALNEAHSRSLSYTKRRAQWQLGVDTWQVQGLGFTVGFDI